MPDDNEIEEVVEEEEEEEVVVVTEDPFLKDMVERLKKQAKISDEKLKDKSLKEQYKVLTFYLDNLKVTKKKKGNKPVVPVVTHGGDINKSYEVRYKTPNSIGWKINIKEILNKKK